MNIKSFKIQIISNGGKILGIIIFSIKILKKFSKSFWFQNSNRHKWGKFLGKKREKRENIGIF